MKQKFDAVNCIWYFGWADWRKTRRAIGDYYASGLMPWVRE